MGRNSFYRDQRYHTEGETPDGIPFFSEPTTLAIRTLLGDIRIRTTISHENDEWTLTLGAINRGDLKFRVNDPERQKYPMDQVVISFNDSLVNSDGMHKVNVDIELFGGYPLKATIMLAQLNTAYPNAIIWELEKDESAIEA